MAITKITANGTVNAKLSAPGYIRSISCPQAGSAWTLQINDGPDQNGNVVALYGATPGTITTGLALFEPVYFSHGVQIVTAGTTPGELDIDIL